MRRALASCALVGATIAVTARLAHLSDQQGAPEPSSPHAVADTPPARDVRKPLVGVLVATESVDLASNIDGQIERIETRLGQPVTANGVVAVVSNPLIRQELRIAEELRRSAAARLRRDSALFQAQAISAAAMDQAQHEARLTAARADKARAALAESTVRAPFDGQVVAKYVDKGAYVKAGQPLLRIVSTGPVRVRFAIPEPKAASMRPGARLVGSIEPEDIHLEVVVEAVSSEVEPSSRMVFAEARIAEQTGLEHLVGRPVMLSSETHASAP